jgi:hypothetical protein
MHPRTLGRRDASYAASYGQRPARRLIYALVTTTLSYGMLSLTVLLTVERPTGSYRDGGFAVAAFALCTGLTAPFRAASSTGAAPGSCSLPRPGYAASLLALDLAAHGSGPLWLLIVFSGATASARRRSSPPPGRSGLSSSSRRSSGAATR